MRQRWMIATTLLLASCAMVQPALNRGTLILMPQVTVGGFGTRTVFPNYTQASIHHLILKLYTYDVSEHDQGIQKSIPNADLNRVVTFSNLKANTTYRIKAYAYASTDESNLISTEDANSYTDITIAADDHPTVSSLKVKLINRNFAGVATSTIAITPGSYSFAASESCSVPYVVETIAGNGSTGSIDATGTAATFGGPYALALDSQYNIYVADAASSLIRKIAPSGAVTTIPLAFSNPSGVAVDALGNVYVAEAGANRIRKITSGGVVSIVAGNGSAGAADGTGMAATFNSPRGVTVDAAGNLYIADYQNNRIRKIDTSAVVTTLAGSGNGAFADGTGTSASLYRPFSTAVDATGNLYVADAANARIRKISPTGVVTTVAGNGLYVFADGIGTNASFQDPFGIAVDAAGNLYVADEGCNRIRKIDSNGMVSTIAGSGATGFADGIGTLAIFTTPRGVAVDGRGNIYVADWQNYRIRRIH